MSALFSEEVISVIASILAVLVPAVLGIVVKSVTRRAAIEKVIDVGIPVAFHVVEEIAKHTDNKVDDKIALGLKKLAEYTGTKGVTPTAEHNERAKLVFQALHAQSKAGK